MKLWPNRQDGRKMARLPLFWFLLKFFKVDFELSTLEGKTEKAVLLIGDRLSEKVKAARRNQNTIKYVDISLPES